MQVDARDDRYHPKEVALGVERNGRTRVYLGSILTAEGGRIVDEFEGRRIRVAYDSKSGTFLWEAPDDVRVTDAYWFAWKSFHPDTEIWRVVSYVRSLSAGAEEVEVPGDPKAGERIYQTRGSCIDCHRVNGKGGRLGPDLSEVGWIRSPQHLEASLRRPSEFIAAAYRQVSVETKDGEFAFGRLLNENTFSVQLMDDLENLRSFMKEDLASFSKPEESMMPAFDGFFNATEIQHLVAYLYSLKGDS